MASNGSPSDFESVKSRLEEIADAVGDESLSLDAALDLYEEAVALGLQASDLLETGIDVPSDLDALGDADESSDPSDPDESSDPNKSDVPVNAGGEADAPES